jgi:hypothetical protein
MSAGVVKQIPQYPILIFFCTTFMYNVHEIVRMYVARYRRSIYKIKGKKERGGGKERNGEKE